ncbi:MAG: EamA family transporter [Pseudonocardiales bacterium]
MTSTTSRPDAPALASGTAPAWLVWLALGTVYLVWGSTYLGIKVAVESLPPLLMSGARFFAAGLVMLTVLAVARPAALRVTRAQLGTVAAVGVLLLLGGNGLVAVGEQRVASGLAALLIAAVPLWIVLLRALSGDRPTRTTLAGVAVGFAGVAVLMLGSLGGRSDAGRVAMVMLAALLWAAGSYHGTRRPMPANPFTATAYEMLVGGGVMMVAGVSRGELSGFSLGQVTGRSWLALGYLAVFGSLVAFTAYVWLLRSAPVSQVSTYAYVNPAVAVLLGALILGEPVTATVAIGGLVILGSVAAVVAEEARRRRHPATAGSGDTMGR